MIDEDRYNEDVNKWFEELKDIITVDLLWQHINKYPEKRDYEIEEQDENSTDSCSEERE